MATRHLNPSESSGSPLISWSLGNRLRLGEEAGLCALMFTIVWSRNPPSSVGKYRIQKQSGSPSRPGGHRVCWFPPSPLQPVNMYWLCGCGPVLAEGFGGYSCSLVTPLFVWMIVRLRRTSWRRDLWSSMAGSKGRKCIDAEGYMSSVIIGPVTICSFWRRLIGRKITTIDQCIVCFFFFMLYYHNRLSINDTHSVLSILMNKSNSMTLLIQK